MSFSPLFRRRVPLLKLTTEKKVGYQLFLSSLLNKPTMDGQSPFRTGKHCLLVFTPKVSDRNHLRSPGRMIPCKYQQTMGFSRKWWPDSVHPQYRMAFPFWPQRRTSQLPAGEPGPGLRGPRRAFAGRPWLGRLQGTLGWRVPVFLLSLEADSNHSFQPSFSSKTGGFPQAFDGFLKRRIPGKNGEGTPSLAVSSKTRSDFRRSRI